MNIIVCVDDGMGMAFNSRRQSKDSVLRARIALNMAEKRLLMNDYSAKQFKNDKDVNIVVDNEFFANAEDGDWCFVENTDIAPFESQIKALTIYRWNRAYPSDLKLTLDLSAFSLQSTYEFAGTSHEKITEEVYVRNESMQ